MNNVTYIISEIGVNWDGDFDLVKKMMKESKNCGCNAVKFQAYQEEMIKDHPQKKRLVQSAITKTNVEIINELAKSVGIEWFCTPMYTEAVDFLDPYVTKFKIREFDGRSLLEDKSSKLIERILKTGKEVIISSQKSPRSTKYFDNPNIKWLYCVPKYPCMLNDLNFKNIEDFSGFSNHCPEIIAPLTASILGAKIVEVHTTLDKSKDFVDNAVSFDYKELGYLIKLIRQAEEINT